MRKSSEKSISRAAVLCLRISVQALLFILVYSYLSDIISPVFTAAVFVLSAASGIILSRTGLRLLPSVIMVIAAGFVLRVIFFTAAGFIHAGSIASFLPFRFDSGFFPLFPAAVYIALSAILVKRKQGFITVEVAVNSLFFVLLLWSQAEYNLTVFSHPMVLTVYSLGFIVFELSVLLLNKSGYLKKALSFFLLFIAIFTVVLMLLFNRYSEGASRDSGGLMQPTLFSFDFSDYIKLESEISMGNDLVLLFRNYGYLNSVYLRRFYLSGYKPERGFYIESGPGEKEQLLVIPDEPAVLETEHYPQRITAEQEYFIVNFDSSSLIAMNYPVEISPLTNWPGSSFLRNYRVVSESVEQPSWELADAPVLDMDDDLYEFYTEYGGDAQIKELAEKITEGLVSPYDKVIAIMFYLHDTYYYSLKPGVAADGNQLHHFLFSSRKGYCSYFAFSMALMCRSIGIPARVAAGFFIDPQSGVLNVYPVREDMAHAWVEVPFSDFGWVEFDPTTDRLAPGEDLEFGMLDSGEYSSLIEEIFENDYGIDNKDYADEPEPSGENIFSKAAVKIVSFIKINPVVSVLVFYIFTVLVFRLFEFISVRFSSGNVRCRRIYYRACRMASSAGVKRGKRESILEHADRVEKMIPGGGFRGLADDYLEAVFSDVGSAAGGGSWGKFRASFRRIPVRKRVLIFLFPFIRFRAVLVKILVLPVLIFMLIPASADAQQTKDPQTEDRQEVRFYLDSAAREQDSENYEAALNLLNDGMELYPDEWSLKKAAGDLYADRELYNLAVDQYHRALDLSPDNVEVLYPLSAAEGLLNLDQKSIHTLERILEIDPENYDALADLGWMYFKTYRLAEAEKLLKDAVEIFDDSPILFMTLGTVYSGLYDYEKAEDYYIKSIEMALARGWDYFASVSYYNLSLLEHGFYNYEKSFEYTNKSIETGERAPGYIARAEIYLSRLDFTSAYRNYQQAYSLDSTPLALMGLADLYSTFGLFEQALAHIEAVLKHDDDSWMYYFGVDPDRHRMETDRLLMEIYYGLSNQERLSPVSGFRRIKSLFKSAGFYFKGWFHERRYRSASFDVGLSNEQQGNRLDASWALYLANFDYKKTALSYLLEAESIETIVAPGAEGSYLLERGRLTGDEEMLQEALGRLDPVWEKKYLSETITDLIKLYAENGRDTAARRLSEELFLMNPGVFIREALEFPLAVDFKPGFFLRRNLKRSGFKISVNNKDNDYRYRLTTADNLNEGSLYSVVDSITGESLFQISVQGRLNYPSKVSVFTAELKKRLFRNSNEKDGPF